MAKAPGSNVVVPFVTRTLPRARPAPEGAVEAPLTVLVVDDTPEDRMILRFALEASGFVLLEAANAASGLKQIAAHPPDCLLLDHRLPDLEGLDLIERLRQPDGTLPCAIILLTGSADAGLATAAMKAGAQDYIVKDRIDHDDLRRSIRNAARQHRMSEQHRRLEQHNAHLAAIVAASADAIVSIEADGATVRSWSPGAVQMFGYQEAEALGRTIDDLIVPPHLGAERAQLYAAVSTGQQAVVVETMRRHKSGALVPVELNVSPMLDHACRIVGYSAIFRDITERRRANQRLASIQQALSLDPGDQFAGELEETAYAAFRGSSKARAAALCEAALLDAPPERVFDQITRLVSGVLLAPMSLLTVIDDTRQFFVSSHGLAEPLRSAREAPLETSYCRFVIESGEPIVIRDAEHNPLVAHIGVWRDGFVSYLAVPIRDRRGTTIASLCAADSKPRIWTGQELLTLQGIARLLMGELENRVVLRDLEASRTALAESEERLRLLADNLPDSFVYQYRIDTEGNPSFEFLSAGVERLNGIAQAAGTADPRVLIGQFGADDRRRLAAAEAESARLLTDLLFEAPMTRPDGTMRWMRLKSRPRRLPDGSTIWDGVQTDITENRRQAEAIRAAEERFRRAADATRALIYEVDLTTPERPATGYGLSHIVGEEAPEGAFSSGWWIARIHPDDHAVCHADVERCVVDAACGSFVLAYRVRHTDGTWREVEDMCQVVRGDDGRAQRLVGTVLDVTEKNRAARQIRIGAERLSLALDASSAGTWEWDAATNISTWDDRYHALYGFAPGGPRGFQVWLDSIHDDDRPRIVERMQVMFATPGDNIWDEEFRIRHPAGVRWMRGIGRGERDAAGRLVFMRGIVLDITAAKQAAEALRLSEERFRTFVSTAQEGIWALDRDGVTTFANPRIAEMLGTSADAMLGRPLTQFCLPEDQGEARDRLQDNVEGYAQDFEFRWRRADGSVLHTVCATAPLRDAAGEVIGALVGVIDLTERKRAEDRQHTLMRELAHRGKNLLGVIQSIARRSLDGSRSMADAREAFTGRLQALANTYGNLTDEAFEGAPLDAILAAELKSFGGRANTSGPRIMLTAKVAQTFALVIHELATNAAKYGALSVPQGHLDVSWRIEGAGPERRFQFAWTERGGPPAKPPTRRGFGTTLITSVASGDLKCKPVASYEPEGFAYVIETRLSAVGAAMEESPVRGRLKSPTMVEFYDAWAALGGEGGVLPTLKRFRQERFSATGALTIAEVDGGGRVEFVAVGHALTERLGHGIEKADLASEDEHSMAEAYRRCARGTAPCHELLRFDFGDGDPVTFERLLVPFSRGGKRATHIAGLVIYSGDTRPPPPSQPPSDGAP